MPRTSLKSPQSGDRTGEAVEEVTTVEITAAVEEVPGEAPVPDPVAAAAEPAVAVAASPRPGRGALRTLQKSAVTAIMSMATRLDTASSP